MTKEEVNQIINKRIEDADKQIADIEDQIDSTLDSNLEYRLRKEIDIINAKVEELMDLHYDVNCLYNSQVELPDNFFEESG